MTRLLMIVALAAVLSSCAVLQTTGEILDILVPDPTPVCDSQSAGVTIDGQQCVKYSDGSYRWLEVKK